MDRFERCLRTGIDRMLPGKLHVLKAAVDDHVGVLVAAHDSRLVSLDVTNELREVAAGVGRVQVRRLASSRQYAQENRGERGGRSGESAAPGHVRLQAEP